MRPSDQKVQIIARETGMLYKTQGSTTEYSRTVTVETDGIELTMEFGYQTPDEMSYIAVYQKGRNRAVDTYTENFEDVRTDYPQFFQD
jgi:hypothetical protein